MDQYATNDTSICWCPVKEGIFNLVDSNLERVEDFTLNVLEWISSGYTVEEIANAIEYPIKVVMKAILYWQHGRFLDDDLLLTNSGKKVLENIKCIKNFNSTKHNGYLNLVTGEFSALDCHEIENHPMGAVLRPHYNLDILRNLDVSNSREEVLSVFANSFSNLTEDEIKDISVAFVADKEVVYMPYRLSRIPDLCEIPEKPVAYLKRKFTKYTFDCQKPELDFCRSDLKEIINLMKVYDCGLFKDKKRNMVLEAYQFEEEFSNAQYIVDALTGKNVNEIPQNMRLPSGWKGPIIASEAKVFDLDFSKIFGSWLYENRAEIRNVKKKDIYVYQPIGMDCLEEIPRDGNDSREKAA